MTEHLLHGDKVKLRSLEPEDLDYLFKWENDTEIWQYSDTLAPISRFILKKYLANAHKDIFEMRQLRMMIQLIGEQKPIGTVDLFDFDNFHRRSAVGILVAEKSERRKGYGLDALEVLKHYCATILQLHQLYCTISVENDSSIELFKKAGFQVTGTRRQWLWNGEKFVDEYFLQLML